MHTSYVETRRRQIMQVAFDNLTAMETANEISARLSQNRGGTLINPNVDVLRLVHEDQSIAHLVASADLVVVDGAPIHWASVLAGRRLKGRVPGANFIRQLCTVAAESGLTVYLLGGRPGAAETAGRVLTDELPSLKVVGMSCPPLGFESDPAQIELISEDLELRRPDIVFCALGFPKQEHLMRQLTARHSSMWFIGSGASIDFVAGIVKRAPRWMQTVGIEWVYRLYREPRRLFRRYIIKDVPFAVRLAAWALHARRQAS